MAVALTVENLNRIQRLLKNAQRLSSAILKAGDSAAEPLGTSDLATARGAVAISANVLAGAKALLDQVNENVQ